MAVALSVVTVLLWKRHIIPQVALVLILALLSLAVLLCLIRPRWFRAFYRAGMTVSWAIGQVVSTILLVVFYLLVLTPIGILARIFGKDWLKTKRDPRTITYWLPTKSNTQFDREF